MRDLSREYENMKEREYQASLEEHEALVEAEEAEMMERLDERCTKCIWFVPDCNQTGDDFCLGSERTILHTTRRECEDLYEHSDKAYMTRDCGEEDDGYTD